MDQLVIFYIMFSICFDFFLYMWIQLFIYYQYYSCTDPEFFVRGGPTLTVFFVETCFS